MVISIITVVLNDKEGLSLTLKSLQYFSKGTYEHVVIDGGSNDGTLDVLERFSDRIDVVISEKDDGLYDAMNKGVVNATGEVVCFLNAGDLALKAYLSHPRKLFLDHDVDYCYAGVLLRGERRSRVYIPSKIRPDSEYLQQMPFPHPGLFVKKELFNNIGYFDLSKKITADHEWIVRMLDSKPKGMRIDCEIVEFGLDGASLSHKAALEMYDTAVKYGRGKFSAFVHLLYGFLAFAKYKALEKL